MVTDKDDVGDADVGVENKSEDLPNKECFGKNISSGKIQEGCSEQGSTTAATHGVNDSDASPLSDKFQRSDNSFTKDSFVDKSTNKGYSPSSLKPKSNVNRPIKLQSPQKTTHVPSYHQNR